jgi:hypothetical protein
VLLPLPLPQIMFDGLQTSLTEYRRWVVEEERVMDDPAKHQQFKQVRRLLAAAAAAAAAAGFRVRV